MRTVIVGMVAGALGGLLGVASMRAWGPDGALAAILLVVVVGLVALWVTRP